MTQATKFDPRLAPITQEVKSMASPQEYYKDKAEKRFERVNGVVTLYRFDDIIKVNRHPAILGNGGQGGSFGNDNPLIPLEIDGEDHKKWRRLLDPIFGPKQIAPLEAQIRQLAGDLIDRFVSRGEAELHDEFCVPLPSQIFLQLVGAPLEDLDFFIDFKNSVIHPEGDTVEEMEANMAVAGAKLMEYMIKYLGIRRKETEQKNDVIAVLLRSEVDGKPIEELDLLNIMFLFMFAGLDTVTASLSCILAWLGQHPEERDRLVADRSLLPAAIEEIIRFESPVPSGQRHATEDIDLGDGLVIKAGEAIHAIWASANVDPNHYENPLEVDFSRGRAPNMVFASGTHRCLGSHLARMEMRAALDEILDRIPDFTVTNPEALVYDNVSVRTVQKIPVTFTPR
ncbi:MULTISPECIES: cytochrome P450 [Mycolicibacterium]|jgi:cytochrome P450|uniref:cytochrome P450 n=1 Tax=Mycolicibacterium TaxID=1866885 RepID=UPI00025AD4BC|nr:cytochrome P450 [Mycolicibacterium phlei]EID11746.1 cytochrome P450 271A1 Cyp271A1 [Mycolicibacterium phlei RIVM601174]MBF4193903.1 cytochrome P450 271A1 [Mycolicibacterium phlei]